MKIAVLFDGAGLARLGLEQAGHHCIGVELDPIAHYLSTFVGSGNSILGDATQFDLCGFDAVWASPPCQRRSDCIKDRSGQGGIENPLFSVDHLNWCLGIDSPVLWVENVSKQGSKGNEWGTLYNAAQFLKVPIQNRNRVIGGRYKAPTTFHKYRRRFPSVCPCITATEYKGYPHDKLRACRFYGRKMTIPECAYHQGFEIPEEWWINPPQFGLSDAQWRYRLYRAIGNGVPVFMAKAFGAVY